MIKTIARRAALSVPPIRRLYVYALDQARQAQEAAQQTRHAQDHLQQLQEQVRHLEEAARQAQAGVAREQSERAERLAEELAAATAERSSLELQLYVLRSDHQRTASRNDAARQQLDELRAQLGHARAELDTHQRTASCNDAARQQLDELRAQLEHARAELDTRQRPQVEPADLELLHAKLSGRLTRGFGELSAALRAAGGGSGAARPVAAETGRYLDLLENALTGQLVQDAPISPWSKGFDPEIRMLGRDWPGTAPTMIGGARMRNIRVLAERVLDAGIPGDFLEAGVWRGGACILMRGILAAYGVQDRTVWVADSFAGLPPPDPDAYPADAGDRHHTFQELAVPLEEVRANFERYGLLDDQVQFLKGWFADTLPGAPIERLAILRLDGDMYSSTMQTLDALYAKVVPGGFVIVDDYILAGCRQAVHDFRDRHGITDEIEDIDGAGAFWRKTAGERRG